MLNNLDNSLQGLTRNKPLLIGGAAAALAVIVLIIVLVKMLSSDATAEGITELTCDGCKAQFKGNDANVTPNCPKCGGQAYASSWIRCPSCKNVWLGLQMNRKGRNDCSFRIVGETTWQPSLPAQVKCPKCGKDFGDVGRAKVYDGWGPVPQNIIDRPAPPPGVSPI